MLRPRDTGFVARRLSAIRKLRVRVLPVTRYLGVPAALLEGAAMAIRA